MYALLYIYVFCEGTFISTTLIQLSIRYFIGVFTHRVDLYG